MFFNLLKKSLVVLLFTLALTINNEISYANIPMNCTSIDDDDCSGNVVVDTCTSLEENTKTLIKIHKATKKRYMDAFVCYDRKGKPFYANEAVYIPQLKEIRALDGESMKVKPVRSMFCEYGTIVIHNGVIGIVKTNMTFKELFTVPASSCKCIYFDGNKIDTLMMHRK